MKVEIWSDVVCPWCYIGKRRFESALSEFPHRDDVEVIYRSFELDPTAEIDSGMSVTEMLSRKYGVSLAQADAMNSRVTGIAAGEGLDYHLEHARHANTVKAHRLIHLAASKGLQDAVLERVMTAYFSEGENIGDAETLVRLAAEAGLDGDEARAALEGDAYADAVHADERRAQMLGITGVPFFVIDERYGVSGAQPAELFSQVLEEAWAESHPLLKVAGSSTDADVCEGDNCALPQANATDREA
ncbi:MAG TPA: DsbA family oxidoreductase [Ktedonobacterales bacterium]|nr:DsbA family oxidoreductase [Ktedonobacterales bacterium]